MVMVKRNSDFVKYIKHQNYKACYFYSFFGLRNQNCRSINTFSRQYNNHPLILQILCASSEISQKKEVTRLT